MTASLSDRDKETGPGPRTGVGQAGRSGESGGANPRELLADAKARLIAAGVASPDFDSEELLAFVANVRRTQLRGLEAIAPSVRKKFDELVERRAAREPLQHLTGTAPFRYLELAVGPGVFIPRPETELVAGAAIALAVRTSESLGEQADGPVVVDLCTGSGAIALAVATEVPQAKVFACELDRGAFAWAERNLAGHDVTLVLGDAADAFPELGGMVDVVVSNPPYIPLSAYETVQQEVRDHDPSLALWSGDDGLDAMRAIERTAARLLKPGGGVVVEHADLQGESAPAVFARTGAWTDVRDNPDLAGRPRFVTARRV